MIFFGFQEVTRALAHEKNIYRNLSCVLSIGNFRSNSDATYPATADTWNTGTNKANCANNSNATTDLASTSISSCATATWCQESYTFTVSASATKGYEIDLNCNSAFIAAQQCEITAVDIRVTPNVTTGINATPPPPELRPIALEMLLCQRYFETTYAQNTAPGSATTSGAEIQYVAGVTSSAQAVIHTTTFVVPMATAAPAITLYSPSTGTSGKIYDAQNAADVTGSSNFPGTRGFYWSATMAGSAAVQNMQAHWTASSEL